MFNQASPRRKIRRAIGSLLATNRFFGVLALRMPVGPGKVETIAGDGLTLTYSEEWVSEATHDEIKGAIAHIVFACALKHHVRKGDRQHGRWNKASRIVTAELLERENIWVPDGIQGRDLPIETVYDQLPEEQEGPEGCPSPSPMPGVGMGQGGQGQGQGQDQQDSQGQGGGGQDDDHQNPGGGSSGGNQGQGGQNQSQGQGSDQQGPQLPPGEIQQAPEEQQQEQDQSWDQASKQAAQISKSTGNQSGNIEQAFEDQHTHRRDWQDILREYMQSVAPTDYSWSRPNRRFIDMGLYLPSLHGEGMGPIVVAIDTSGSVDDLHVNQACTEMFAIARDVGPERIHLLQCDTRITDAQDFDPTDAPTEIKIRGRGGTKLEPVFEYIAEQGIQPELLVYMTDLEVSSWPEEPDFPVVWAVENDHQATKAPWGQTVVVAPEAAR